MTHAHSSADEIVITKSDNLEVEVNSGAMTRLAGVSELLTGSTGIQHGDRYCAPWTVFYGPLSRQL